MEKRLVRLGLFFDGPNHSEALAKAGLSMNYASFLVKLRQKFDIVSARYYSGVSDVVDHAGVLEFLSTLSKNGYVPVTKPTRRHPDGSIKANLDVELAVDMIMMAPRLDKVMLFSGDGDFTYLVDTVQRFGLHVTVCTHKPFVSMELRRQCDEFLDLKAIIGKYKAGE